LDHVRRIVVIENSGSGKSYLADLIAQTFALSVVDLDQICSMALAAQRRGWQARSKVD
jgi:adenylate kinase family enzyme